MNANLISESFAADILAVSVNRLQRMVRARQLPFVELPDGSIRFNKRDLLDWLETRRRGQPIEQALSEASGLLCGSENRLGSF